MSEFQYHEWQAIDRVLTPEEQATVNDLSSHIEVSSSRAVVTYHWSSFRHDPKQVLLKYFDAYFYLANWGSLRLVFRFPKGLLNEADMEPYCIDEIIALETIGKYQVLDLDFKPEYSGGWMEANTSLSNFIRLRADLLEGDYRLLYLAWLKAMTMYGDPYADGEFEEDEPDIAAHDREPPIPPGMKKLTPSLQNFVQVFSIDPFLVQAAAEASPDIKKTLSLDYRERISQLSRAECDDFLGRLAEGDPGVGLALRKRLSAHVPQNRAQPAGRRTIQQLLQRAKQLEQAEKERQAEAARQKHIADPHPHAHTHPHTDARSADCRRPGIVSASQIEFQTIQQVDGYLLVLDSNRVVTGMLTLENQALPVEDVNAGDISHKKRGLKSPLNRN